MKNRVSLLALRIAAISEEFSETEIREAVKLLEQQGSTSALLSYLVANEKHHQAKPRHRRKSKLIEDQRSKAVLELEHKNPEKYEVLSEFDALLRKGSVLPQVMDLKRLGKSLSKTFSSKSSRREAISRLMMLLAERPLSEIREVVRNVLATHQGDDGDSDYYKLAQFIITGKTSLPQNRPENLEAPFSTSLRN